MEQSARVTGLRVREGTTDADLALALALRAQVFRGGQNDRDAFDAKCCHFLVEDIRTGAMVACWRLRRFPAGSDVMESYAATAYGLSALAASGLRSVELGRLAIAPDAPVQEVSRLTLAATAAVVEECGADLIFGCVSAPGTDPSVLAGALRSSAVAGASGRKWNPDAKSMERFSINDAMPSAGTIGLPPLLRTYLALGGRVSDHVVTDRDLGTVHVFVGLEVADVPPSRARVLRTLAAQSRPEMPRRAG